MSSRNIEPDQVRYAFSFLDDLMKYTGLNCQEARVQGILTATLDELRYRFYHHLLGEGRSGFDLDMLDVRHGNILALSDISMYRPKPPNEFTRPFYKIVAEKLGVPYLEIVADLTTENLATPRFIINGTKTDYEGWRKLLGGQPISLDLFLPGKAPAIPTRKDATRPEDYRLLYWDMWLQAVKIAEETERVRAQMYRLEKQVELMRNYLTPEGKALLESLEGLGK